MLALLRRFVVPFLAGSLMFMSQVGPADVVSNLSKWWSTITDTPMPVWVLAPALDKYVFFAGLLTLSIWVAWYLSPQIRRAIPSSWARLHLWIDRASYAQWKWKLKRQLPTLKIEIRSKWLDQEHETQLIESNKKIEAENPYLWRYNYPYKRYHHTIHILNTSREGRVSLHLAAYLVNFPDQPNVDGLVMMGAIKAEGLKLNLGPEEETEGRFTIDLPEHVCGKGVHTLLIVERIAGRQARVRVPGRFPPQSI